MTRAMLILGSIVLLVVAVGLGARAFAPSPVDAASAVHRVMLGLTDSNVQITRDFPHDDNPSDWRAIDQGKIGGSSGLWAAHRTRLHSGSGTMTATTANLTATTCSGVMVNSRSPLGQLKGTQRYVHISPTVSIPSSWTMVSSPLATVQYLGQVSTGQDAGCPWDAPHLHQAESIIGVTYNANGYTAWSTYDALSSSNWLFQYFYAE
ncbi:MAG: hypothetical protein WD058_07355 [Dehalococcoidia bacterium]